jgi:hypothetical protein
MAKRRPTAKSNRSRASSNRVSEIRTRILKFTTRDWRTKFDEHYLKIEKKGWQRLAIAPTIRGNIAQIFVGGTRPPETALPGWAWRTRSAPGDRQGVGGSSHYDEGVAIYIAPSRVLASARTAKKRR